MMRFLDIFMPAFGLLMLIVGVRERREAKRIRRDVAELWANEALTRHAENRDRFEELRQRIRSGKVS